MLLRSFHQVSRRFSRNAHAGWAASMSLGPSYRSLLLLPRLPSPAPSMSAPPMTTLSAHSGGTFEAGGTGLPRGEHLEGAAVTDRRDQGPVRGGGGGPAAAPVAQPRTALENMMGVPKRAAGEPTQNGRTVRQKKVNEGKVVKYQNEDITIFNAELGEDERWCHVLKINANGTKDYKCLRCGWRRTCKIGEMMSHCLRISGEGVKVCDRTPTEDQLDICGRASSTSTTARGRTSLSSCTSTTSRRAPTTSRGCCSSPPRMATISEPGTGCLVRWRWGAAHLLHTYTLKPYSRECCCYGLR